MIKFRDMVILLDVSSNEYLEDVKKLTVQALQSGFWFRDYKGSFGHTVDFEKECLPGKCIVFGFIIHTVDGKDLAPVKCFYFCDPLEVEQEIKKESKFISISDFGLVLDWVHKYTTYHPKLFPESPQTSIYQNDDNFLIDGVRMDSVRIRIFNSLLRDLEALKNTYMDLDKIRVENGDVYLGTLHVTQSTLNILNNAIISRSLNPILQ